MLERIKLLTPSRALSYLGVPTTPERESQVWVNESGYSSYLPGSRIQLLTGKSKEDTEPGVVSPGQTVVIRMPEWPYNPKKHYIFSININPELVRYAQASLSHNTASGSDLDEVCVVLTAFKKLELDNLNWIFRLEING